MKKIIFLIGLLITTNFYCQNNREETSMKDIIQLSSPMYESSTSVEEALLNRRSVRDYKTESLSLSEVSQILWSAQGIADTAEGLRTAPSAGALYPLEVYLVAANVKDLNPGIYKYNPQNHILQKISEGDKLVEISDASLKQESINNSSAIVVITAIYERTSVKYGNRTERYVDMEVGHVGQNIYLQAVSLGLGTVMVGAFNDEALKKALALPEEEHPLALYPIGRY